MKVNIAISFLIITLTLAVIATSEATDEDINSPLVSYLLAKIQRLESKVMAKPSTSLISKRSSNVVEKKTAKSECPPPTVSYTRWGNSSCPFGANTVYQGVAAGGHNSHKGSPANMMCLPPNPMHYPNNVGGSYYAYGVEYQTSGAINHADDRNMPCAMCEVTGKSTTLMIPSHYVCPTGWREEYKGYIMAGAYNQEGCTMYNCIDTTLEQIPGSGGNHNGHQLYTIYASSSQFLPYDRGYALSCVVCSK